MRPGRRCGPVSLHPADRRRPWPRHRAPWGHPAPAIGRSRTGTRCRRGRADDQLRRRLPGGGSPSVSSAGPHGLTPAGRLVPAGIRQATTMLGTAVPVSLRFPMVLLPLVIVVLADQPTDDVADAAA